MCLCVIRHKAGATPPNEQTPALCSGPRGRAGAPNAPQLGGEEGKEKFTDTQPDNCSEGKPQQPAEPRQPAWLGVPGISYEDPLHVLASKDFLTRQYVALSRSSNWQKRRRPSTPLLRTAYLILESVTAKMILFYFVALNTVLAFFFFFFFSPYFTQSPERKNA